jgi:hypothetical protein
MDLWGESNTVETLGTVLKLYAAIDLCGGNTLFIKVVFVNIFFSFQLGDCI